MVVTHVAEERHERIGIERIDLEVEPAAGAESLQAQSGDGAIEQQCVVVGHEQRHVGFMLQHVRLHCDRLLPTDVGWVRDDEGEGSPQKTSPGKGGFRRILNSREGVAEDVLPFKPDADTQSGGVVAGNGQGVVADVPGSHFRLGQLGCQRQGDAARARADVENTSPTPALPSREGGFLFGKERGIHAIAVSETAQNPAAQLLGLGARNEHAGSHAQATAAKLRLAHDILHGFAAGEPPQVVLQCRLVQRLAAAAGHVDHRQPVLHLQQIARHSPRLALGVAVGQSSPEFLIGHLSVRNGSWFLPAK